MAGAMANFYSRLSDCSGPEHKYIDTAWVQGEKKQLEAEGKKAFCHLFVG